MSSRTSRKRKERECYSPTETIRNGVKKENLVKVSRKTIEKRNKRVSSANKMLLEKCGKPFTLSQENEAFIYNYDISDKLISKAWDVLPTEIFNYEDLCRSRNKSHYHIEISQFDKMDKGKDLTTWIREVMFDFLKGGYQVCGCQVVLCNGNIKPFHQDRLTGMDAFERDLT